MRKNLAGAEIEKLIQLLSRLPGLGPRSARRAALHLIKKKEILLLPLGAAIQDVSDKVSVCTICGNIDTKNPCGICTDPKRDHTTLIVVEDISDLWALERAPILHTGYHILGGTLSPLNGVGPEQLNLASLLKRVANNNVTELILAMNATVEGQTTAHYITSQLRNYNVKVTRLAHGVPVGGELDYLDDGTLAAALKARTTL